MTEDSWKSRYEQMRNNAMEVKAALTVAEKALRDIRSQGDMLAQVIAEQALMELSKDEDSP